MLTRQTTQDYICEKLLEMIENTPFHRIKVIDLVNYANVSRSTFYLYFDSLYDVLQMIEDNYIHGLRNLNGDNPATKQFLKDRMENITEESKSLLKQDSAYIQKNLRIIRILCSENGDPYFATRLTIRNRKINYDLLTQSHFKGSEETKNLICTAWSGGIWQMILYWANHEDEISTDEFLSTALSFLKGIMDILEAGQLSC